ncbi:MAG: 50S ribosomal protein L19e [Candidatus Micrarchaeota archaeon]|nr:50S ribosomal protein L19e [Candidatus Micrarchaeota archaeon]
MNLKSQKEMAAKVLKVGKSRVRVDNDPEVAEAITRNDIKELIRAGIVSSVQKKGTCSAPSKKRAGQKNKGRRMSRGSKKGTKNARKPKKERWIEKIRPIRKMLKDMKEAEQITTADYRKLYRLSSGGTFRSKKHALMYIKDHDMLQKKRTTNAPKKTKPTQKGDEKKAKKRAEKKVTENA